MSDFPNPPMAPVPPTVPEASNPPAVPTNPYDNVPTPPPEKKGASTTPLLMVAIILGITAIVAVLFLFLGNRGLSGNPTKALIQSLDATNENIKNTPSITPDISHLQNKPSSNHGEFSVAKIQNEYSIIPYNSRISFDLGTDLETRQIYANLDIDLKELSTIGMGVYINPELIALKSEYLLELNKYIVFNTDTFFDDLNQEPFRDDQTLEETIIGFFEYSDAVAEANKSLDTLRADFTKSFVELRNTHAENFSITFGSTTEGKKEIILTIAPDLWSDFAGETATLIENYSFTYYKNLVDSLSEQALLSMEISDPQEHIQTAMETVSLFTDALRSIKLEKDVTINLLVDKKTRLISEVDISPQSFLIVDEDDGYSDIFMLSFHMTLDGKEYLTEQVDIEFLINDPTDSSFDELHSLLTHRGAYNPKELLSSRWEMTDLGDPLESVFFFDYGWNPNEKEANNLSILFGTSDNEEGLMSNFALHGTLLTTPEGVYLKEGRLSALDGTVESLALNLEFSSEIVDSEAIKPDLSSARSAEEYKNELERYSR